VWQGASPPYFSDIFWNFKLQVQGFTHFIAKNYLLSETGSCTGLIDHLGPLKSKRHGVENLAGVNFPLSTRTLNAMHEQVKVKE